MLADWLRFSELTYVAFIPTLGPKENSSKRYGHVSIVDGFGRMWIHGGTHGATVPPADQMDYIELDRGGEEDRVFF